MIPRRYFYKSLLFLSITSIFLTILHVNNYFFTSSQHLLNIQSDSLKIYQESFELQNESTFAEKIKVNFDNSTHNKTFISYCPEIMSGKFEHGIPKDNYQVVLDMYSSSIQYKVKEVDLGGIWHPKDCKPLYEPIALILPIRGRPHQLYVFLPRIHFFLQQQKIPYVILTINQTGPEPFNRGLLFNIGVLHVPENINCFILSDVDMLPDLFDNMYTCNQSVPKHLSPSISKFNYKLIYRTNFGGVVAFTRRQFYQINGFSTKYWGWGGEDDDLYKRVIKIHKGIYRVPMSVGRITHLNHFKNESGQLFADRFKLLKSKYSYFSDGLHNCSQICKINEIKNYQLRTDVVVRCIKTV